MKDQEQLDHDELRALKLDELQARLDAADAVVKAARSLRELEAMTPREFGPGYALARQDRQKSLDEALLVLAEQEKEQRNR